MIDFVSDILSMAPLAVLALFVGGWLGAHVAPGGWTGMLVGAGLGAVLGFWLENSRNPSVARLRRYAYGALILAGLVLAIRHWLAK